MRRSHPVPEAALDADIGIGILGRKGRGKTYIAKGLVERFLLALGRRIVVLDPLSVWWGLHSNAGGTGPGFAIVGLGGTRGDLRLSEGMSHPLALTAPCEVGARPWPQIRLTFGRPES